MYPIDMYACMYLCHVYMYLCRLKSLEPIISFSQKILGTRIEHFEKYVRNIPVDPAAHLDLHAYNMYEGGATRSLAHTPLPLMGSSASKEREEGQDVPGEKLLEECHLLGSQYLNELKGPVIFNDEVSSTDVEHIVDAYSVAIKVLLRQDKTILAVQAMNELAMYMYHIANIK